MRIRSILLGAGAALIFSAGVASAATVTTGLNLRSGPGTHFGVVDTMPAGAHVAVLGCNGAWCHVNWNGEVGYASASFITGIGYASNTYTYSSSPYYEYGYYPDYAYDYPYDYGWYGPGVTFGFGGYHGHRHFHGGHHHHFAGGSWSGHHHNAMNVNGGPGGIHHVNNGMNAMGAASAPSAHSTVGMSPGGGNFSHGRGGGPGPGAGGGHGGGGHHH